MNGSDEEQTMVSYIKLGSRRVKAPGPTDQIIDRIRARVYARAAALLRDSRNRARTQHREMASARLRRNVEESEYEIISGGPTSGTERVPRGDGHRGPGVQRRILF